MHAGTMHSHASRRLLTAIACCLLIGACATGPQATALRAQPALLSALDPVPARDARAGFRANFCASLAREPGGAVPVAGCDALLWHLDDEPAPAAPVALPDADLRVYVVGGAFSDCFGEASVAYREGIERLRARGVQASAIAIESRSGSRRNASLIAERLRTDAPPANARVILVGYSKGAVDILDFLVGHPVEAQQVDAVVSVAGPVRGSALADQGAWLYDHLLAHAFSSRCTGGDGGVLDSIRSSRQGEWLAAHALPVHVRYYSLSAFTTRGQLARALRPSWRVLARGDPRNDGQVTVSESLLPGSTLLGYANADHWSVAIDIEQAIGPLAGRKDATPFPRAALFESIVTTVAAELTATDTGTTP